MPNDTHKPSDNKKIEADKDKIIRAEVVMLPTWGKQRKSPPPSEPSERELLIEPPTPPHSLKKLALIILAILFVLLILQRTESYVSALVVGIIVALLFSKQKILSEIDTEAKMNQDKRVGAITRTVLGASLRLLVTYLILVSFLLIISVPVTCSIQNSLNINFFSKQFCKSGSDRFLKYLEENSHQGY